MSNLKTETKALLDSLGIHTWEYSTFATVERALTEIHQRGWGERKEVDIKTCAKAHSYHNKGVSACIQAINHLP